MTKRKELAKLIRDSDFSGCGCCASFPEDEYDDDGVWVESELSKLATEWGVNERHILLADEIIAGLALEETE